MGRVGVARPQASGLSLRFSPRAQNRFELGCKTPPNLDKSANSGAKRPFLFGILWFCGAKPICFSGGRIGLQARGGALFWFLAAAIHRGFWYNERATNFTGNFLYLRALMTVLDNLGFLSWLHQDGHLSWRVS